MSIVSLAQHMNSHRGSADGIGTAREQQLQAAAEQFEALFLQQILKQMRKASDVLAEGNPMRSRELDTMRDFYDEVLAETLAGRKQTGIADMLVKQLSGAASQAPDLEVAAAAARSAELPQRSSSSLLEPLRATWQRGVDGLGKAWDKGSAGFLALVDRVIQQESAGRVDAVSPKGARGLMQLMPDTAREMAAELGLPEPEETGTTFEENAWIKASAAAAATGLPALSDDSGLMVDALDGAPGVYTANWAERPDGSRDFMLAMRRTEDLLVERQALSPAERRARFVAVICLVWPEGHAEYFRGEAPGHLVWPPRGDKGFGYDPVFQPDGHLRTFGEMDAFEKHGWKRGLAILTVLVGLLGIIAAFVLAVVPVIVDQVGNLIEQAPTIRITYMDV